MENNSTLKGPRGCNYKCAICDQFVKTHFRLILHIAEMHQDIQTEMYNFDSIEDFMLWKQYIEEDTRSSYVRINGVRKLAWNRTKRFYHCHRSFSFTPKGNGKRCMKANGTNKIDAACPARMEVTIDGNNNSVVVNYTKTHVGHEIELSTLRLSKRFKDELAEKLRQGIAMDAILDSIRNDPSLPHRSTVLVKQDLRNIIRDYRIKYECSRHEDDMLSVGGEVVVSDTELDVGKYEELEDTKFDSMLSTNEICDSSKDFIDSVEESVNLLFETLSKKKITDKFKKTLRHNMDSLLYLCNNLEDKPHVNVLPEMIYTGENIVEQPSFVPKTKKRLYVSDHNYSKFKFEPS